MFERLQQFLAGLSGEHKPAFAADDPRVSVIALCIQVMEADGQVLDVERAALRKHVKEHYDLEASELEALIAAGTDAESEAIDFFRFTSGLKRQLTEEQKVDLVGLLWEIVYADGERSEMEDHAIWRIADLLGVSGRERIMKRQEVAGRMAETGGSEENQDA
ncbi:TerB family tellurite resistance protein [Rhizobium sp. TRM95111]|uniref:tellurite resistance TerB family protein n=1 Tax=Rhizobium alarense TaxID=2846851 RepID=UPI001F46B244|nr:TerB family tellurite resistance protein [Rhizobium alarense]MCF3640018.1 TerB family tellurite resistance protein [Rhizobium alarense]